MTTTTRGDVCGAAEGFQRRRRAGGGGNDDAGDLPGHDDDGDIASAVASIASLALLGSGAAESMESADDHAWDDFGDQPSWRVAI